MRGDPIPENIVVELNLPQQASNGGLDVSGHLTDMGNAHRLVARHGGSLRFCYPWNRWLVWNGRRWKVDDNGAVEVKAKETVRSIYAEAAATPDSTERRAIADHARRSEAKSRVEAMIHLARSEPGIPVLPDELDRDPWLLNVQNGTVDLHTGELRDHDPADLITKLAPVEYDPEAEAPTWETFLQTVLPDKEVRTFVQRAVGYSLTGNVSEQVLLMPHGSGANGKSTLLDTVLEMLGDYGQQAAPDLLVQKRGSHPTELADLFGARLVASIEVEDGGRMAESLVKQLTGGDRIKARRMREDFWQFAPTHKTWLAANHKPVVRGTDHAIWRRIRLIPFDVTIAPEDQDKKLPEKLRAEMPGILNWALQGCLDWQSKGLGEPEAVASATEGYRSEMDTLAGFIDECCVVAPHAWVRFKDLYAAYVAWCEESGERAETKRSFGTRLKERGFEADRGAKNVPIRRGIALQDDRQPPPDKGNPDGDGVTVETAETGPEAAEPGQEASARVTQVTEGVTEGNPRNPCKFKDSGEGVTVGYPEVYINEPNGYVSGLYTTQGNHGNQGNPAGDYEDFDENPANPEPAVGTKVLRRVRWAFKKEGRGPAANLGGYFNGDVSLDDMLEFVLFELGERRAWFEDPTEAAAWTEAVRTVAEEHRVS